MTINLGTIGYFTHTVLKIFTNKFTKSESIYFFLTVFKDSVGTNWLEAECDRQAREVSKY